jgi:uncharacterized membrane protein
MKKRFLVQVLGISLGTAITRTWMASAPNVEPVMLSTIVSATVYGPVYGFVVGVLSMIISNVLMSTTPLSFPWILQLPLVTVYTSLTYGIIGLVSGFLFSKGQEVWSRTKYAIVAGIMTIFYDVVTAIAFALQFYGIGGIMVALVGQVPFTILHLSNVLLAFVFAPLLYNLMTKVKDTTEFKTTQFIDA